MITKAENISEERDSITLDDSVVVHVDTRNGRIHWMSDYSVVRKYVKSGDFIQKGNKLYFV